MDTQPLADLLNRRMVDEECSPADPITVSDLLERLIPYRLCRSELRFATKAEYDVSLLGLLGDSELAVIEDGSLRKAISSELKSPEPGLGFLGEHGGAEIVLASAAAPGPVSAPGPEFETGSEHGPGAGFGSACDTAVGDSNSEAEPEPEPEPDSEVKSTGKCRSCAEELPSIEDLRYCPSCGVDQDEWMCEMCGGEIHKPWRFCPRCGAEQPG